MEEKEKKRFYNINAIRYITFFVSNLKIIW